MGDRSDESAGFTHPLHRTLLVAQRYVPVALVTLLLARVTTQAILARTGGEPAAPLDDAYIHFQYARALAEGRFYAFLPGEGYTSGATSLLWPAMLAPFYLLGFRDTSIIWVAWTFGWIFLALLAVETKRLAAGLVGELPAIGAGATVLAFGAYTWFAPSCMEVTPLAWLLAFTARQASRWQEDPARRTNQAIRVLLLAATLGPLLRPEGTLASLFVVATLAAFPAPARFRNRPNRPNRLNRLSRLNWPRSPRWFAFGGLVGPLLPPLLNRIFTGQWATTTTLVKWMPVNPYYGGSNLFAGVRANLEILVGTLFDGRQWSALFLPPGGNVVMLLAFGCIPFAAVRSRHFWRGFLVLLLAAAIAWPTTYLSFLWNRLRYLWPFAFAWGIALACLARVVGDLAGWLRPRFSSVTPLLVGVFVGLLAHQLPWSIDDVATSAYAIQNQQVTLGRWARDNLPRTARIGVNDTGAIAYLSERPTFDVVGLTTPGEARYWVAGAGSRFEHYERIHEKRPDALPTHFIVYPHWMACDAVLGRELTRATVLDQTILGGPTMIAYEARYDLLHTGHWPAFPPSGELVDELDVSDLEMEEAHHFDVLGGGGVDTDNVTHLHTEGAATFVDGGRGKRHRDRFVLSLPHAAPSHLVARWHAPTGAQLVIRVRDAVVAEITLPVTTWIEATVRLPAGAGTLPVLVTVESTDERTFGSLHYWAYRAQEEGSSVPLPPFGPRP